MGRVALVDLRARRLKDSFVCEQVPCQAQHRDMSGDGQPEHPHERRFAAFVFEEAHGEEGARPAAEEGEGVEGVFGRAAGVADGAVFVDAVGGEGEHARCGVPEYEANEDHVGGYAEEPPCWRGEFLTMLVALRHQDRGATDGFCIEHVISGRVMVIPPQNLPDVTGGRVVCVGRSLRYWD